jgi:hypothetical protein
MHYMPCEYQGKQVSFYVDELRSTYPYPYPQP